MKIKYSRVRVNSFEKNKKNQTQVDIHERKKSNNTLSYLLYFLLIVGFVIIFSLSLRFIFLFQQSTFTTQSYSVLINSKEPFIASINTSLNQLSFVKIPTTSSNSLKESLTLGVPIDAIVSNKETTVSNIRSIQRLLNEIFSPWSYRYKDMNVFDSIKLFLSYMSVPKKDVRTFALNISKDGELSGMTQEELYATFKDSQIVGEQKSIEIINATQMSGLAGMMGKVLKNAGGNVVSVKSGEMQNESTITSSRESETIKRISHLLGVKPIIKENFLSISDIQIILGTDFGEKFKKM